MPEITNETNNNEDTNQNAFNLEEMLTDVIQKAKILFNKRVE